MVLWCRALPIEEAQERVASIAKGKPSWLRTMVVRLKLDENSTLDDVNRYLDAEKPRFLFKQTRPSDEEIEFWLRVAGPTAKDGPIVTGNLKENLNRIADLLGKRLKTIKRPKRRISSE